ncbi:MAG TPA: P1 family peptidase [Verrucomicrobiae bacterium]|nr:P1 family peptidase [Verrucomicrobiae bacterium]
MGRARLRDLGFASGYLPTGPLNAITDVPGVRVGHCTVVHDQPFVARSGVTAVWPASDDVWRNGVFAGFHSFNGNGEMTGTIWIEEQGLLAAPLCITNTHSVGVVHDALVAYAVNKGVDQEWHLPVTAETYDGWLSDAEKFPVKQEHAFAALDSAKSGPVDEGCVGGGTGMICHEFKGGIGTSSRIAETRNGKYTVGALVQANYGDREQFRVDGAPVGREITREVVPAPDGWLDRFLEPGAGSIIVILATDAPLLPIQCKRLARRAATGLAWVGGYGSNGSGDIFLAFANGNRIPRNKHCYDVKMMAPPEMSPLFEAAAEATEEAILNALTAAETTIGFKGRTVHALPFDLLEKAMRKYGRPPKK